MCMRLCQGGEDAPVNTCCRGMQCIQNHERACTTESHRDGLAAVGMGAGRRGCCRAMQCIQNHERATMPHTRTCFWCAHVGWAGVCRHKDAHLQAAPFPSKAQLPTCSGYAYPLPPGLHNGITLPNLPLRAPLWLQLPGQALKQNV